MDRFETTLTIVIMALVVWLAIAHVDIKKEYNEKQIRNELRMKEWLAGQEMRPDYRTAEYRRGR